MLLKFFELIPPLIDLINLLFIYQYKMNYVNQENSSIIDIEVKKSINPSIRLNLSLTLALIRFIISLVIVYRICDRRWKRQIFVIFDLLLFILVNISLIRYSYINPIRIGRKIILGLVLFQLNSLFYNETFWIDLIRRNEHRRYHFDLTFPLKLVNFISNRLKIEVKCPYLRMIYLILYIRRILSIFIVYSFIFYTFRSIINDGNGWLFFMRHVHDISFKSYGLILLICMTILYVIRWDTLQNHNALDHYGISRFCTGIDLLSSIKSTETLSRSSITTSTAVAKIPRKKKLQTCVVCYDDKDLNEFNFDFINDCQHLNRSICNSCLFRHVQQAFQITFTDDIYCPELQCGVKLNYYAVKNILFLHGDNKLVERYKQYVFHRQLEQMDEFIWCSNPLCNVGQLNENGVLNNIVTCFNCHQKTCFTHKVKWHEGLTCEEYDLGIDQDYESSRRWIVENSKKCPKCPYQIEKNDGCDHMTCIKCRHEFCWSCLVDFQPIRQHGNHRHKPTCKHYARYDGE
ncbi:unnamed protein product [Rotaria sp. Silwood1]|nr:unnamed protein product [Rotaria sp. Silwood1]CAF4848372.1 unnamed protein product [Rotaria sp. Silwood1]